MGIIDDMDDEVQYYYLLHAVGGMELTLDQERFLRWLSGWDKRTIDAAYSLFEALRWGDC